MNVSVDDLSRFFQVLPDGVTRHLTSEDIKHWLKVLTSEPPGAVLPPKRLEMSTGKAFEARWTSQCIRAGAMRVCEDYVPTGWSIIVLCGKPRAGKDATAEHLARKYGQVARIAFSDAVMEEVNRVCADWWVAGGRYSHEIHEGNKSLPAYRRLLQDWGMLRRRSDSLDYWVRQVNQRAQARATEGARLIIVTGARSPADVIGMADAGAAVWYIDRPAFSCTGEGVHPVENLLNDVPPGAWDAYLVNREDDLEYLHKQAEVFAQHGPIGRFRSFIPQPF